MARCKICTAAYRPFVDKRLAERARDYEQTGNSLVSYKALVEEVKELFPGADPPSTRGLAVHNDKHLGLVLGESASPIVVSEEEQPERIQIFDPKRFDVDELATSLLAQNAFIAMVGLQNIADHPRKVGVMHTLTALQNMEKLRDKTTPEEFDAAWSIVSEARTKLEQSVPPDQRTFEQSDEFDQPEDYDDDEEEY